MTQSIRFTLIFNKKRLQKALNLSLFPLVNKLRTFKWVELMKALKEFELVIKTESSPERKAFHGESESFCGFYVKNFWWALIFSLVLSLVGAAINHFEPKKDAERV
jgi:hypothetical protein